MSQAAECIRGLSVRDIRFPTSLEGDGSDAMHKDPDYSCAYVILYTDQDQKGHGFTFTIGRGTEIVVAAVKALSPLVVGQKLSTIFGDFAAFWRNLTSETQIRWLGPEKGVVHLASAAILNALWDLWAKIECRPLWKLLVDMEPEVLLSTIDFRYLSDAITKEEALEILKKNRSTKHAREVDVKNNGLPAYTTACGWLGYSNEKIEMLCKEALTKQFTRFKVKVGENLDDDKRRCSMVRQTIGNDNILMVDANQRWDVQEAIDWMTELAEFKPLWIEEPTSPDDVLGHLAISKALNPLGISVATGEQCQNRVMFKQFLTSGALQYCQIDACRMGGVSEVLAVLLMAAKYNVPVCPHAGGVGLCELVQHLAIFDYICVGSSRENRMIEFVDHLHEHFENPVIIKRGNYMVPKLPGYSATMKEESLQAYEYPTGSAWIELFNKGHFKDPSKNPVPPFVLNPSIETE